MQVAALGIAIVSLVVAVLVALAQVRQGRRLTALREPSPPVDDRTPEDLARDTAAEIQVSLDRMGHASELVVENTGNASASDVTVTFDPPSSAGGPMLHEAPFPSAVHAHHIMRIPAVISFSTPPNEHTTVRWSDERGPHERIVILPTT